MFCPHNRTFRAGSFGFASGLLAATAIFWMSSGGRDGSHERKRLSPGAVTFQGPASAARHHGRVRPENFSRSKDAKSNTIDDFRADSYNKERFSTLSPDGKLSIEAIEEARLSDREALLVQSKFDEHKRHMVEIMKQNLNPDVLRSDIGNRIYAYTLRSYESSGVAEYKHFLSKLDTDIGEARRELLMSGYSLQANFLSYGKQDVRFKIYQMQSDGHSSTWSNGGPPEAHWQVETTYLEPGSGKIKGRGLNPLEAYEVRFGDFLKGCEMDH